MGLGDKVLWASLGALALAWWQKTSGIRTGTFVDELPSNPIDALFALPGAALGGVSNLGSSSGTSSSGTVVGTTTQYGYPPSSIASPGPVNAGQTSSLTTFTQGLIGTTSSAGNTVATPLGIADANGGKPPLAKTLL